MADIYQIKWQQSVKEQGQQTYATKTYELFTDNNIFTLNPINSNWQNNGCYAGALAQNGSIIGNTSVLDFSGWKEDRVYSDMRDFSIQPSAYSGQQNLRLMIQYGSSGFSVLSKGYKWTGLRDETVDKINESYSDVLTTPNINIYDPFKRDYKNLSSGGISNSPLNVAPLNNFQINNLIFLPMFIINEVEYYGYNSDVDGYTQQKNASIGNFTWRQIKNADKLPEGISYDEELFTKGYKSVPPTQEDGIRFRYCAGCYLIPYYGKSSKIYDPSNDTYIDSLNEDGNVYGNRLIFGSVTSDSGSYPIIGNTNNLNRPCLFIISEIFDSNTNGIVYQTPPGIIFNNNTATGQTAGNTFSFSGGWSISSDFRLWVANSNYSSFWFNNNSSYCNFYKDLEVDEQVNPAVTIHSTSISVNADITGLYSLTTFPTGNFIYVDETPTAYSFSKSNRNVVSATITYFSISELWHTIASLGCYVADDVTCAQNAPTGESAGQNNHLYLGYMSDSGITNGTMIQGLDIVDSTQAKIDDIIEGTPYTPINPSTPDIPDDDPDRENIKPPNREGDNIPLHLNTRFGAFSGFLSLYNLTQAQLSAFGSALMGNPLDYRGNFEKDLSTELSGTYDVSSILNYIVSARIYPFNVDLLSNTTENGTDKIYIGTGNFGVPIGSACKKLTSSISFVDAGSLTVAPLTPYKDFRDYYNTTVICYLPFCGTVELNPIDIMNTTLHCYYLIDFLTGACSAVVYSQGNSVSYPVAISSGNIGVDIPLSATNAGQLEAVKALEKNQKAQTIISEAKTILSGIGDAIQLAESKGKNIEDYLPLIDDFANFMSIAYANEANPYGGNKSLRSAVASPIIPAGIGASNFMLQDSAYIQIRRGTYSRPDNYGRTVAYPNSFSSKLSSVHGLTYCYNVNVSGISCTAEERAMIKNALESGTILP